MAITLIRNVRVIQTMPPFDVKENVDILIDGDVIKHVGAKCGKSVKADKIIEGKGKTVIPGFVCAHHHYYSGLSRGMQIDAGPQNDIIQILQQWWWRLDRGLDEESVYLSSLVCSIDAISCGTTSCIDHHSSPNFIDGSLSTIARGMEETGVRGATCFEVTDRNDGMNEVLKGIAENVRFAKETDKKRQKNNQVLVESFIGGHAPFTLPDAGLELMKDAVDDTKRGMHIHIAEGDYDELQSHHLYHMDIMDRLDSFGLLSEKSLLVHGIYLNDHEIDLLNERGCFLAHNPRSNMNNNIGYSDKIKRVKKLVMGTDGCGGNMFEEIKTAFFKNRDSSGSWWPEDYLKTLTMGNKLLESCFPDQKFGRVEAGYKADLNILDYRVPTPIVPENVAGHVVWGMSSNCVETVIVNGHTVMENRKFNMDVDSIYARARECSAKLWERTNKIK